MWESTEQDLSSMQQRRRMSLLPLALALCVAVAQANPFTCPTSQTEKTLTMQCHGACANDYSPCIYYASADECSPVTNSSTSECVAGTGDCAIECFYPFSGETNSSWYLMVTTDKEYYRDVRDAEKSDPDFHIAMKPEEDLEAISDLQFPANVTEIWIVGNALPVLEKAEEYSVIYTDGIVDVSVNYSFLLNATSATHIMFENVNISSLEDFPELPLLETLFLSNARLHSIPSGLTDLASLSRLDLSMNTFGSISSGEIPTNLVDLCIASCSLDTLPSDLLKMTNLTKLDISNNKFGVPDAGTLPTQLEYFVFYGFSADSLPGDLPQMTNLKELEIGWNALQTASSLENLPTSLERIHIVDSYVTALPSDFANLTNVTYLDLKVNYITDLSKSTFPPNLKTLNMSYNGFSTIPSGILPKTLEFANLSYNYLIGDLPDDMAEMTSLTTLCLQGNNYQDIPRQLFNLTNLQYLYIYDIANMTGHVTLTQDEVAFLNNLTNFTIDAAAFVTTCDETVQVASKYEVCLTTDTSSSNTITTLSVEKKSDTAMIAGIIAGVVAAIVVAAFVYRRQKRREEIMRRYVPRDGKDSELCYLDDVDPRAILSNERKGNGELGKLKSSLVSIWEDEELLKYRIDYQLIQDIEMLAVGYYGEVWLATYLGKPVAVKRLKHGASEPLTRRMIHQFVSEIKFHSRFDHPKIVAFVGVAWTRESDIEVAVEYMINGDLRSYLSSYMVKTGGSAKTDDTDTGGKESEDLDEYPPGSTWDQLTIQMAIDITEALVYLHSLDNIVIHRDLKSRNVLLDDRYQAKVGDFGTSRYQDDIHATMTTGVGTARWAAPEMLAGNDQYTEAVDIYSLGVILSELDTYHIPFDENVMTESALLSRIAAGEVQPRFTSTVPREIYDLAQKCLAFDPNLRPSAVQVAYLLRQFLAKRQRQTDDSLQSSSSLLTFAWSEQ